MIDSLTFRFTQDDGTVIDETVDLDFSDVSSAVLMRAVNECEPDDMLGMAAILVHSRLSDPELATPDMLKDLFKEMVKGGVTVGV